MGVNPNGWDIQQSIQLAQKLKSLGVDVIDCSSGGIVPDVKYPKQHMFQIPYAEAIRRDAAIATAAVGSILEGADAEDILQTGKADFILVGRGFLRNSAWAMEAALDLGLQVVWPHQYAWAVQKARKRNKSNL
jgi:2,4-dienoyl-CoA reductase-like NADH-dependent reductase (Old Yellow Enzyme family)